MPGKRKSILSTTSSPTKVFKRIIGQRIRGDKTYYNVQWQGQLLRTWEREESLSPGKVAEFKGTRDAGQSTSTTTSNDLVSGFQRCLEPERITGMYEVNGELMFNMKWKGSSKNDFVPISEAKLKCPQVVIEYYEKRIVWLEV